MKALCPYLFFNGNCKEAMEFYKKIFGGELKIIKVGDTNQEGFKDADQNLVMHADLKSAAFRIMASDNMSKDTKEGDSVCLMIECSSQDEVDKLYAALSKGGEAGMKPEKTFWGSYFGSTTDMYGNSWMFDFQG